MRAKILLKTPAEGRDAGTETLSDVAIERTANRDRLTAEDSTREVDVAPPGPMALAAAVQTGLAVVESGGPGWAGAAAVQTGPAAVVVESGEPGWVEAAVARM